MTLLSSFFHYFNAWLLMVFVVACAVVSEKIYFRCFIAFAERRGMRASVLPELMALFRATVSLPGDSRQRAALYCPAFAIAALLTICASLPICTYMPIVDNGADMVQFALIMLLSEVFVVMSLYAAGSSEALEFACLEMRNMLRFLFSFMAACSSIADYLIKNALESDPRSLNSLSSPGQMRSMSWCGIAGGALFILTVMSQTPQRDAASGTLLLKDEELAGYGGAPRGLLQLWSVMRAFIVIAVMTYIIFPNDMIGALGDSAAISWRGQAVNFIVFWFLVSLMRICAVPFCRRVMSLIESPFPEKVRGLVPYVLSVCAVLLVWYEGLLLSVEAAAF